MRNKLLIQLGTNRKDDVTDNLRNLGFGVNFANTVCLCMRLIIKIINKEYSLHLQISGENRGKQ